LHLRIVLSARACRGFLEETWLRRDALCPACFLALLTSPPLRTTRPSIRAQAPELSLDIGGAIEPSDDAEDASAFETGSARGLADTPPEWAGNSGSSFTVNNTSRETQGDDEWVQELYDMQGMVGEES